ncbi:hypothetical protein [Candidatus Thiosymbion oneisti]|uniref:hypothetical protein n=1 Tax=Candidatus Thiosymbion oneisti TaxID=589554 RepID=UPI000B7C7308|nr:hypothetical protein [Candidatus Thiosymbion oneisti]
MGAIAAAPALAAGPPGWAVFGVVAVGTAAYGLAMSSSRHQTKSASQTKDATHCRGKCRDNKWSARVHAQGKIIGGTTKSTVGAPAIFKQSPVTVAEGIGRAEATFGMLTKRQKKVLELDHESCKRFIESCPSNGGFLGSETFPKKRRKGGNRIDLDSYGPSNNFTE